MSVRLWVELPAAERLDDSPKWADSPHWLVAIPSHHRCQAAVLSGHRHRVAATRDGLCFVHYDKAGTATRARARALALRDAAR